MRTDRLLRLAEYLDMIAVNAPEQFDLRFWSIRDSCGTTACAVGHACNIPEFQEAGLRLVPGIVNGVSRYPEFEGWLGSYAAAKFFEVSVTTAEYLFFPGSYRPEQRTAKHVADRIRSEVASESAGETGEKI